MADEKTVKIIIEAQSKVDAATKDVRTKLEGLKGSVDNMQPAFKKMAAVGTIALASISALAISSFKAFADAQAQTVITNKSLENSLKQISGDTLKKLQKELGTSTDALGALKKQAEDAGKAALKLGFDDEEAARSFAKLFGVTKNVTQANKEMALAMDLARYKNISLEDATQKLMLVHAGATKELKSMGLAVVDGASAMDNINAIMKQTTGTAEEFGKTAEGAMQIAKVNADNLKESIGAALEPAFNKLKNILIPVVQKFVDWAEKNPELLAKIILISGAVAALVAGLGLLGMALPGIIAAVGMLSTAFAFLAANPIILVIAALAIIATALKDQIAKLYGVKVTWMDVWKEIQNAFKSVTDWIADRILWVMDKIDMVKNAWGKVTSTVGNIGTSIKNTVSSVFTPPASFNTGGSGIQPMTAEVASPKSSAYNITFNGDITDKNEFLKKLKDSMSQVLQTRTAMP